MPLTFYWTCNSSGLNSPSVDYSAGDTSATSGGTISLSSAARLVGTTGNGISLPGSGSLGHFQFDPSGIASAAEGAFGFLFCYPNSLPGGGYAYGVSLIGNPSTNQVVTETANSGTGMRVRIGNASGSVVLTAGTIVTAGTGPEDVFGCVVRWKIANDYRAIEIYDYQGALVASTEDSTTDLSTYEPDTFVSYGMRVGKTGGTTMPAMYIDNVLFASNYDEPLQNNLFIEDVDEYSDVSAVVYTETLSDGLYATDDSSTDVYGAPTWAAVPSVTSQTSTAYTVGATRSITSVLYGVAVNKGDTAPSIAQIKSGYNAAGQAAKAAASSASGTGAVSITLTPSDSPAFPVYDLYFVLSDGTDSSRQALLSEYLDAPTNYLRMLLASVSATGSLYGSVAAPGDVWQTDDNTTEDSYALTLFDSGDFQIAASGDPDRLSFTQKLYDVSAATWLGPGTVYVNNNAPAPVGGGLAFPSGITLEQNSTITPFNLADECTDVEADTFTVSVEAGSWPTGLSMGGGPTYTLSGTPTEYGRSEITLRWTDSLLDYYDEQVYVNIGPKLPDVVGDTVSVAQTKLALASLTISYVQAYDAVVAAGDIISMSPVALTVVPYDQVVTLTVSLGPEP